MATAVFVVGKDTIDHTFPTHLNTAFLSLVGVGDGLVVRGGGTRERRVGTDADDPGIDGGQTQETKQGCQEDKDGRQALRFDRLLFPVVLITNLLRAGSPPLVTTHQVEDKIIETGTSIPWLDLADMNKNIRAARKRRDESKSSGVIPLCDPALLFHQKSAGLTLKLKRVFR